MGSPAKRELHLFGQRLSLQRRSEALALVLAVLLITLVAFAAIDIALKLRWAERLLLAIIGGCAVIAVVLRQALPRLIKRESLSELAILADKELELDSTFIAAVQFQSSSGAVDTALAKQVIDHADKIAGRESLAQFVKRPVANRSWLLVLVLLVPSCIFAITRPAFATAAIQRLWLANVEYPTATRILEIRIDGASVWARGDRDEFQSHSIEGQLTEVIVVAEGDLPEAGVAETVTSARSQVSELMPSGEEGIYVARLPSAWTKVGLRISLGDDQVVRGELLPRRLPVVEFQSVITPPKYSGEARPQYLSQLRFPVKENSSIRFVLSADRTLRDAVLKVATAEQSFRVPFVHNVAEQEWRTVDSDKLTAIKQPLQFSVELEDEFGLSPEEPIEGLVTVVRDQLPRLTIESEFEDFLAQAEPVVRLTASDDVGLKAIELHLMREGESNSRSLLERIDLPDAAQHSKQLQRTLRLAGAKPAKGDTIVVEARAADQRGTNKEEWSPTARALLNIVGVDGFDARVKSFDVDVDRLLFQIETEQLKCLDHIQSDLETVAAAQRKSLTSFDELINELLPRFVRYLQQNNQPASEVALRAELRQRLNQLVDESVTPLLMEVEQGDDLTPVELKGVGKKCEQILLSIASERNRIAQRLRVATLAGNVRRIISLQSKVATLIKESNAGTGQPQSVQRLTYQLYLRFIESLRDISTWDGPVAGKAKRIEVVVTQLALEPQFRLLLSHFETGRFDDAQPEIERVQTKLDQLLLTVLGVSEDRTELLKRLIRAAEVVIKAQQTVLNKLAATELDDSVASELTDSQSGLHRRIGELALSAGDFSDSLPPLQQAKQAATQAMDALFELKSKEARIMGRAVVSSVERAKLAWEQALASNDSGESSQDLAEQLRTLASLHDRFGAIIQMLEGPFTAQRAVGQLRAASQIARTEANGLSAVLRAELNQHGKKLEKSANQLSANAELEISDEQRNSCRVMLLVLRADVSRHLQRIERRQLSTHVAELARAVEVLERLNAQVRPGLSSEKAARQSIIHSALLQLHDSIGEQHGGLRSDLAKIASQLKPKTPPSSLAVEQAERVGDQLVSVADRVRGQIQETSKQLSQLIAAQTQQSEAVLEQVRKTQQPLLDRQVQEKREKRFWKELVGATVAVERGRGASARAVMRLAESDIQELKLKMDLVKDSLDSYRNGSSHTPLVAMENHDQIVKLLATVNAAIEHEEGRASEIASGLTNHLLAGRWNQFIRGQTALRMELTHKLSAVREKMQKPIDRFDQLDLSAIDEAQQHIAAAMVEANDTQRTKLKQTVDQLLNAKKLALAGKGAESRDTLTKLVGSLDQIMSRPEQEQVGARAELEGVDQLKALVPLVRSVHSGSAAALERATKARLSGIATQQLAVTSTLLQVQRDELSTERVASAELQQVAKAQGEVRAQMAKRASTLVTLHDQHGDEIIHDNEQIQSARQLKTEVDRFANAQKKMGELAQSVAVQQDLGNAQLRAALETTSQLYEEGEREPTKDRRPLPTKKMGTGFVPDSPDVTAREVAGAKAMQLVEQMIKDSEAEDQNADVAEKGGRPKSENADEESSNNSNASSEQMANQGASEGSQQTTTAGPAGVRGSSAPPLFTNLNEQTWFAQLPPSIQQAIRSKSRRAPPKTYQRRLRRYFQSR